MNKNQGFTLVELIIVIVILGILAVTAAPRFLDFSGDARTSTLQGVRGALESASALVYGKAIIAGVQNEATATVENDTIDVVFGYPAATVAALRAAAELDVADWAIAVGTGENAPGFGAAATGTAVISAAGSTLSATEANACHVVYAVATSTNKPVITVYSQGC